MESYDIIDGMRVPGTVITSDQTISDVHRGSVKVQGCKLRIVGGIKGSVSLIDGASVDIEVGGYIQGSTSIAGRSHLTIRGRLQGSTSISAGSVVVVESSGRLSGSLRNDGDLLVRGAFGGASSGSGLTRTEGHGYIKEPRIEEGVHYYDW